MRVETIACDLGKPAPRGADPGPDRGARPRRRDPRQQRRLRHRRRRSTRPTSSASSSRFAYSSRRSCTSRGCSRRRWSSAAAAAILNVASTAGMQPMPYSAGYSAAKAYVLTFSEALHQEMRGHGVTVTALAPGPVETDFWQIAGWETSSGKSFERAVPGTLISSEHAARAGRRGPRATASASWCRGCRSAPRCWPAATSRTRSSCRRSSASCALATDSAEPRLRLSPHSTSRGLRVRGKLALWPGESGFTVPGERRVWR